VTDVVGGMDREGPEGHRPVFASGEDIALQQDIVVFDDNGVENGDGVFEGDSDTHGGDGPGPVGGGEVGLGAYD
jgi:hypothetical protein